MSTSSLSAFYVSTPIYYVNGEPHIGHAYTTIVADVMAKHYRQRGNEVFFLTGTDEHGLKVQRAAEELGISPKELADRNSASFMRLFEKLETTHDRFIRTTDAEHARTVAQVVERMKASGDVYLDSYAGWYAASDEAFFDESEIEDGRVKSSGSKVEWVEEKSYFFRLSKYEKPLLEWYEKHPEGVKPDGRRNEVSSFVAGGLRDLSISRTTFKWGIPWPGDADHVLYVWVDALSNYLTGVGAFSDPEMFEKFWPCDVHLIGKDILRFHAVYWPAFLMSAGVELPKQVFAHGWWLNEGQKMSKSLGNFIDAFELAEKYPLDLLRYYLLREKTLGSDGNFAHARIIQRNNSELADNIGNLVNRAIAMTQKFCDGHVPTPGAVTEPAELADAVRDLEARAKAALKDVLHAMDVRETHHALERIMEYSSELNQFVAVTQPWSLNKKGLTEPLNAVMYQLLEGIRWLAVLLEAFLPHTATKIAAGFGFEDFSFASLVWGGLKPGTTLSAIPVLFEKIELPVEDTPAPVVTEKGPKAEKKKEPKKEAELPEGIIGFEQFMAVELKIGHILTAEPVDGADKLLKLSVDAGEAESRTIVAGIAKSFSPEDLVDQRVAMVANLQPRKVFGILSQGMLLAVETEDGGLELARYSPKVKAGTRIS